MTWKLVKTTEEYFAKLCVCVGVCMCDVFGRMVCVQSFRCVYVCTFNSMLLMIFVYFCLVGDLSHSVIMSVNVREMKTGHGLIIFL